MPVPVISQSRSRRRVALVGDPLLVDCVEWWPLDDDTWAGVHGGNNLTQAGTVDTAAGLVGDAAVFNGTSGSYLSCPAAAGLHPASGSPWSLLAWVHLDAGIRSPFGSFFPSTPNGWLIDLTGGLRFYLLANGTAFQAVTTGPAANNWSMIHAYFNGSDEIGISLNNGTHAVTSVVGTVSPSSNPFYIGDRRNGNTPWDGLIDEVAVFNRMLSDEDLDRYQTGIGYPG